MKLVKFFSILGVVAVVTACGSSQPSTGVYGNIANPYGTNYYPQNGNNTTGFGGGTVLVQGQTEVAATANGATVTYNFYVNAGDKPIIDLSQSKYQIYRTRCAGFLTVTSNIHPMVAITNASLSMNGQPVASGAAAPAAGMMTFTAQLSPLSATCEVVSYGVYLVAAVRK